MSKSKRNITNVIKDNFRFSTLSFIFIIFYVNIFQILFDPENSIVGVIFTIMMSASMVRDLTATPFRHLFIQALVLVWMAAAAFWVSTLPAPLSFVINFITLLVILYAFTYEYSNHIYFPYILSYLFLIFISPVNAPQLPKRMLGMAAGAVSIMLYQWIMGRKRVVETAKDVLTEMIDDISLLIANRLGKTEAVSYTHLDVYKRQHFFFAGFFFSFNSIPCLAAAAWKSFAAQEALSFSESSSRPSIPAISFITFLISCSSRRFTATQ